MVTMKISNFTINKKRSIYPAMVFGTMLFIFGFFSVASLRNNIHGDAKFHSLFAKESSETGKLVSHYPHRIYKFDGAKRVYTPISYPLTDESFNTVLYTLLGEIGLKLYAPFCAGIIFLLFSLILKDFGKFVSIFVSLLAVFTISERLFMTPLIEPFLIIALLSCLMLMKRYFETFSTSSLVLASFFIGVAASIKQQGLILSFAIIFYLFILSVFKFKNASAVRILPFGALILFITVYLLTCLPALSNQISRNGTLAFAPGKFAIRGNLPFKNKIENLMASNFPSDPKAMQAKAQIIGYNNTPLSLTDKTEAFILSPFIYYRAENHNRWQSTSKVILGLTVAIMFMWVISKDSVLFRNKFFWVLYFTVLVADIFTSYLIRTPAYQYHSLGILLITSLIILSLLRITKKSFKLQVFSLSTMILLMIIGYINYILPMARNSGREDNYHLNGYKLIGRFVQSNTSPSSVFLAAETSFDYYSKRDAIWVNEDNAETVKALEDSNNRSEAQSLLKKLNVNYVVINLAQTKRNGVIDYMPPYGLISIIDNSPHLFQKIYDPYGDGQMTVYKVRNE
jgi:hypothetical protein